MRRCLENDPHATWKQQENTDPSKMADFSSSLPRPRCLAPWRSLTQAHERACGSPNLRTSATRERLWGRLGYYCPVFRVFGLSPFVCGWFLGWIEVLQLQKSRLYVIRKGEISLQRGTANREYARLPALSEPTLLWFKSWLTKWIEASKLVRFQEPYIVPC